MQKPLKNCPQCIYGNPCYKICINASCRKPGFICESGLKTKSECALFHDKCETMLWTDLENIICENPNTKIPQFYCLQEQLQSFFSGIIKKVKDEHVCFRNWLKLFGYSQQTMNFINLINESNYNNISGSYLNQVLSALFMHEQKNLQVPFSLQQCTKIEKDIEESLQKLHMLYSLPKFDKVSSPSTAISNDQLLSDSKISQDSEFIKSLFPKQIVKKMNLVFRASENNFSAIEFHKKCDNVSNTLTLIETEYGKVIGGYTPLPWNSSKKHWAADKSMSSLLFSVNLQQKFNLNLAQFAVACNPQKGPIFGCCDICIVHNSNVEKSNAEFPISYNNFKYMRNPESSLAFTGNAKGRFTTKEWEVFQIIFVE